MTPPLGGGTGIMPAATEPKPVSAVPRFESPKRRARED
jgi:hypothetical protein